MNYELVTLQEEEEEKTLLLTEFCLKISEWIM